MSVNQGWQAAKESVPRLVFAEDAWKKMMAYVQICPEEINGYGLVDRIGDDVLYVPDIFTLDQTVSAVSVESGAEALATHAVDMLAAGDDPSRIRLQWHSHVSMPAYFSATDHRNIASYGNENCSWMVGLVLNKRGEYEARLDMYSPFRVFVPLVCELALDEDDELQRQCATDILRHVRRAGAFRKRPLAADSLNPKAGQLAHPVEGLVAFDGGVE